MIQLQLLNMQQAPPLALLQTQVSTAEWQYTQQLRTPLLRTRYLYTRATLRQLLAIHLGLAPLEIQFTLGPYKKPLVAHSAWGFSLSHSQEYSALAIAPHAVGLDIELTQTPFEQTLCPVFLTPQEQQQNYSSSELYRRWCLKEALLKAHGTGLYTDPRLVQLKALDTSTYETQLFEHRYLAQYQSPLPHLQLALAHNEPNTDVKCLNSCYVAPKTC